MTKIKDVVIMKVPFPNIDDNLAVKPHMYVCIKDGSNKEFLSCQTKKPFHITEENPPFVYVEESSDITRNPFRHQTLIACDYAFGVDDIHIDPSLLTTKRRDICDELYEEIKSKIQHNSFSTQLMDIDLLLRLNSKMINTKTDPII